jgi:predicted O-methyltransferase YrrM
MKHFFEEIKGWFDFDDLYADMVKEAKHDSRFLELGVWKGRSAAFMAVEIANSGKQIQFDVVDNFQWLYQENKTAKENFAAYRKNYQECLMNLSRVPFVRVIGLPSPEAVQIYDDGYFDFIFIDANHDYTHVKEDIKLWLPKVKPGGLLAGHDYINWPGVKKAVDELLPDAEQVSVRSWIWRRPL